MKKRFVIVRMGFGGIRTARILAGKGHDVVPVDRNNYHLFQPLLYQVATAGLEQESIAHSAMLGVSPSIASSSDRHSRN